MGESAQYYVRQKKFIMKPYQKIAFDFASALVTLKYREAQTFLTDELKEEYSPEYLEEVMSDMFSVYDWKTAPYKVEFKEMEGCMEDWPDKEAYDVGWVYIGIFGESAVEAVTVIVANTSGNLKIRYIEWGRP